MFLAFPALQKSLFFILDFIIEIINGLSDGQSQVVSIVFTVNEFCHACEGVFDGNFELRESKNSSLSVYNEVKIVRENLSHCHKVAHSDQTES